MHVLHACSILITFPPLISYVYKPPSSHLYNRSQPFLFSYLTPPFISYRSCLLRAPYTGIFQLAMKCVYSSCKPLKENRKRLFEEPTVAGDPPYLALYITPTLHNFTRHLPSTFVDPPCRSNKYYPCGC